jgi:diguanylate cyclase (GGDEF)-like protein/PAS domain S-box-containing protein
MTHFMEQQRTETNGNAAPIPARTRVPRKTPVPGGETMDVLQTGEDRRYRAIFEQNPAIMVLVAPESGAIIEANHAAEAFYGYSRPQLRTMHLTDMDIGLQPVQKTPYIWQQEEQQEGQQEGQSRQRTRHRLASGEVREVQVVSSPVDLSGQSLMCLVIHDMTSYGQAERLLHEREAQFQEREARHQAILNALPDAVFIHQADGTYVDYYTSAHHRLPVVLEDFLGKQPHDVLPMETATLIETLLHRTFHTDTVQTAEYTQEIFGKPRHFEARAVACCGDQVIMIIRDITESKQAAQELQKANQQLSCWITRLEQSNREVTLINQMGDYFQSCLTVNEAYMVVEQFAARLFEGQSGALYILNPSHSLAEVVATWGEHVPHEQRFAPESCWALRVGKLNVVENTSQGLHCKHMDPPAPHLCVPLIAQSQIFGLLHLRGNPATPYQTPEHRAQLARTVAEHIALALANLHLREQLRDQSIHDALTGLFNRRYLMDMLKLEFRKAQRQLHTIGVIMIDIDHFKSFNDTYGHDAGDTMLQAVGDFLQSRVREEDIACRYGGEEFTIILPGTSLESARKRAEELREGVALLQVTHAGRLMGPVTFSLGVACFPEHGTTVEAILKASDTALYQAKAAGRNCVVVAG